MSHNIQPSCQVAILPCCTGSSTPRTQPVILSQRLQPLPRFPLRFSESIDLRLELPCLSAGGGCRGSGVRAGRRRSRRPVLIEQSRWNGDSLSSEILLYHECGSGIQRRCCTTLLRMLLLRTSCILRPVVSPSCYIVTIFINKGAIGHIPGRILTCRCSGSTMPSVA